MSLLLEGNFRQILARQPQEELKLLASHSFWNQEWHLAFVFFVLFKDFFCKEPSLLPLTQVHLPATPGLPSLPRQSDKIQGKFAKL